jgi:hypothetical protein
MSGVELFALPAAIGGGQFTLGTAMTLGGALFSAVSSISQGNAARASGEYNAALYARNAEITRQKAQMDETRQRRLSAQRMGTNVAAAGASGIDLSGSVLDVLESNAAQEELDALTIRWNGQNAADSLRAQGALASAQGRAAQTQGYVGAGSALLLGGVKAGDTIKYPDKDKPPKRA